MESLQQLFGRFLALPQESQNKLESILTEKTLQKGELWIQEGEICDKIGFIERGLMRSFYYKDKKDITISFSTKGEFISSMSSFISRMPSYESAEALEICQVIEFQYDQLMPLLTEDRHVAYLYQRILEQNYIELEEHLIFSKFKSAKERYLELMETKPYIIHKASVGQIASYLDMSLETLSRIRATI
ncbi:Crp/Fnr family transcriptional regulator [Mariniradius sediminis]|uniref:Crp/Fnr family transcriptional regulator n=1 Tax=Mariniradius sediminis TaxID=2909237 RepID=A0ABS9BPG6_9BACT|nr:Crp/Fnr family transcriptional regulator [Mariniradius sediminis]MCF1749965.1 Crp/Fnr family transcriptional regulator [Mariniradius sediminis]